MVTVTVSPAHACALAGAVTSHSSVSGREFPFELDDAFGNMFTAHGIGLVYCACIPRGTSAAKSAATRKHFNHAHITVAVSHSHNTCCF